MSNFEKSSIYIHNNLFRESKEGSSNITLTCDDIMKGLYVITSNGGDMYVPTGSDICSKIPENVRGNHIFFSFLIMNSSSTNITLRPNTDITFHPSGNITLHKDKCYQLNFRISGLSSNSVQCFVIGYT